MGIVYTAKCEICGYVKQLYAGGGRMDCTLSAFLKELPEEKQEILKKAVSDGARASITRNKCVCDDCGEIYAVPVVMIELNGKKDSLNGICPKCSSENYTEIDNKAACPVCKEQITLERTGLWD